MTVAIIAELSANVGKSTDNAIRLVDAAKSAGADYVKVQAYRAETLTLDHDGDGFLLKEGTWAGRRLHKLYQEAETPREIIEAVFARCQQVGLPCFASVFSKDDVDFVARFDPPFYKIASFEANDIPLIRYAASKGKPLIISTGVVNNKEIEEAVEAANAAETILLHCISEYPASADTYDLGRMKFLADKFKLATGLSDHSTSLSLPAAATALGAAVIEKHMRLDEDYLSPDASFSLTPVEFRQMVDACREAEAALKVPPYKPSTYHHLRRSLYVVEDIAASETFTEQNIRSIRPSHGLEPKHLPAVLGKRAAQDLKRGTPLRQEHITKARIVEAIGAGHRVFGR